MTDQVVDVQEVARWMAHRDLLRAEERKRRLELVARLRSK
jgi:hypothetical protein